MQGLATVRGQDMTPSSTAASRPRPTVDALRQALQVPFAVTRLVRVPDKDVRRLRCGGTKGARTWRFDLVAHHESGADKTSAKTYSAAVVELRSPIDMRLSISRRGPGRKAAHLNAHELEVGTDALRRRYIVRGTSPELAAELLDDELCSWLLGLGRGFHYEISHDRVIAYGRKRQLGGRAALCAALGLATTLRDRQLVALGYSTDVRVPQRATASIQASSSTSTPAPVKQTSPAIFMASARGSS